MIIEHGENEEKRKSISPKVNLNREEKQKLKKLMDTKDLWNMKPAKNYMGS